MSEPIYKRVSNSSLPQHVGEPVTILGEFVKVEPSGRMFTLKISPNSTVTVHLQEPVQDAMEGMIEVQGTLSNSNAIQCEKLILIPMHLTDKFDLALYNEVMMSAERLSSHYIITA